MGLVLDKQIRWHFVQLKKIEAKNDMEILKEMLVHARQRTEKYKQNENFKPREAKFEIFQNDLSFPANKMHEVSDKIYLHLGSSAAVIVRNPLVLYKHMWKRSLKYVLQNACILFLK